MKPVILVDVMNLVFRCHWAYRNLSYEGQPTGVQFGFLKIIYDLRETVSPRILFCWDHGVPVPGAAKPVNWRDSMVSQYKGTRKHDDTEYKAVLAQLPQLYRLLNSLGYCSVSVMGLEADDIIGLLVTDLSPKNEVLIFSNDHDFYQLLSDRVKVLVPKKEKGGFRTVSREDVETEYEIPIDRFSEFLALGGDASDNIKPCRGMGPKTALKLLKSGVDLSRSYEQQPPSFRAKYSAEVWKAIMGSQFAAQIPTSWGDPRIKRCLKNAGGIPQYFTDQVAPPRDVQEKFFQFLAERNMVTLLSVRRKFYSRPLGEPSCLPTSGLPPVRPPVRTRVPLI